MGAFGQDKIGFIGIIDGQQNLFGLAVDAVDKGLISVRNGVAIQDVAGQTAHDIAMHAGGAQADHQQGGGFADDLIVEFKRSGILWMVAQKYFKVEQRHEPAPVALEYGLAILDDTQCYFFHISELYFILEISGHKVNQKMKEKLSARLMDNPAQWSILPKSKRTIRQIYLSVVRLRWLDERFWPVLVLRRRD